MHKQTKIIATIGPSCESEEMIEKLILHGVNIFRFNFKHNSVEWHSERIELVNRVAKRLNTPIGTLIDLQGPSLRIILPVEQIEVQLDELLNFGEEVFQKGEKGFSVTHPDIIPHLQEGQKLLADDGNFVFYVEKQCGKIRLRSKSAGVLKNHKSLNIPGSGFPFPILIDRDFEGLRLAARQEIDFIALSFVRSADDIKVVRKEGKKFGITGAIIAKIETQKALDHLDEIICESDGVMVARGDLGVEIALEKVPYYQKLMIRKCLQYGKPVITATQMLQSMVEHPQPTRAEVSDVANAIYDETDCVMLSAESASGKYPLQAVNMMRRIAEFNETKRDEDIRRTFDFSTDDITSMFCESAYGLYLQYFRSPHQLAGFLVFSQTGRTAKLLSRYRPKVPIYTFVPTEELRDALTIYFGVIPFFQPITSQTEVTKDEVHRAVNFLVRHQYLPKGKRLIVLHGDQWGVVGGTSTIRIVGT